MKKVRRHHSTAFKAKVALEAAKENGTVTEVEELLDGWAARLEANLVYAAIPIGTSVEVQHAALLAVPGSDDVGSDGQATWERFRRSSTRWSRQSAGGVTLDAASIAAQGFELDRR